MGVLSIILGIILILFIMNRVNLYHHNKKTLDLKTPLYSEKIGKNRKNIVLLHGLMGSGRYWNQIVEPLSQKFTLLIPDWLGFGRSPWPNIDYTADEQVKALSETIDSNLQMQKINLVGHSMGALLSLHYAAQNKERIEKIILISPPLMTDKKDFKDQEKIYPMMEGVISFNPIVAPLLCHLHESLGPLIVPLFRFFSSDLPREVSEDAALHIWKSAQGSLKNVVLGESLEQLLQKTAGIPTLILIGDHDIHAHVGTIKILAEKYKISYQIFEGDHNFMLQQPKKVMDRINEFLAE